MYAVYSIHFPRFLIIILTLLGGLLCHKHRTPPISQSRKPTQSRLNSVLLSPTARSAHISIPSGCSFSCRLPVCSISRRPCRVLRLVQSSFKISKSTSPTTTSRMALISTKVILQKLSIPFSNLPSSRAIPISPSRVELSPVNVLKNSSVVLSV